MSQPSEKIDLGSFYHIYNRGINSCNLFMMEDDYRHLLLLYEKYIDPIAEIYSYVLLPNHIHLLVRIKENVRYKYSMEEIKKVNTRNVVRSIDADKFGDAVGLEINKWETVSLPDGAEGPSALKENGDHSALKENDLSNPARSADAGRLDTVRLPDATRHFSHFFNAYAKYYNTRYNRHGALFERPFKRKRVDSNEYLKNLLIYIHTNPVHHGFVSNALEYGWSSYLDYLTGTNPIYQRCMEDYFGDINNFRACHQSIDFDEDIFD
ncbi:transposase [Carboxylicivirga caseinilyticus]|uniref:transposase n=1 Tax=Carboxylicivirga caseinilyticus TaxID=3417572 RepID=UPI003D3475CA|nr:transposase [Marinilabiliaceae bacterium A049]